jgi:class 3 adenylate cyclase/tetratricopeptide (TPR) repeat protein
MTCPGCQRAAPEGAAFCPHCGTNLELPCPACGASNAPGDNFCRRCGQRLAAPAAAPSAETVVASRSAREGERKVVTVLFADIKGSMERLAGRDPEEARQILDPTLQAMIDAVHRYEGTVNQVMGDGIMALFGAPIAHEDHALRACYAALRIQEALRERGGAEVRIGINSGEVVVRAIGSDVKVDYTAVGETTHLAARLEQRADPGSVLLTAATLRLAEGFVDARPLGPQTVKGRAEPVEIYELKAVRPARTRLHVATTQALSPFVGRADELAEVRRARGNAWDGRGQVVAVVGEAGVGKSRFVWELVRESEAQGWRVLETGCLSYGRSAPYLPVVELLRTWFGIQEHDEAAAVRQKVLAALDRALADDAPALLALLGLADSDRAWMALDPPARRTRTLEAVKRLVLRAAHAQPLLLVVEDLHWVDSETQSVLDGLVDALPASRLLLLLNYRPEYRHGWGGKTYYRQVGLASLAARTATALLDALLGADESLASLKRELLARTDGNPFFLEESVRALVESGALEGSPGQRRYTRADTAVEIPPTVQAVLAARIDRLPPDDKRVLQCAAVVGQDVPLALMEAVSELPPPSLRATLGRLQAAEFVYEAQLFPDVSYAFKHALTHEVAYAGLLTAQRRELHARIASAMARTADESRLAEQAERLSYHALRGEQWQAAFTFARRAAARSAGLCVDDDAERLYERAVEAISRVAPGEERDRADIDLRLEMRSVLWRLGRVERMTQLFADAEAVATRLGDPRRLNAIYAFLLQYYWAMGEPERALEFGARCLDAAKTLDDRGLAVVGNLYLGHIYHCTGDPDKGVAALQRNIDMLVAEPTLEQAGISGLPYAMSCVWASLSLADTGEFEAAERLATMGHAVARKADHAYSLAVTQLARGNLLAVRGDSAEAIAVIEPALATCREKQFVGWIMIAAWTLTTAFLEAGRPAEALAICREGRALKDRAGAKVWRGREQALLSEAHLANDLMAEARVVAEDAIASALRQHEIVSEGLARTAFAGVLAAENRPAEALAELDRAQLLLDSRNARPWSARADLRRAAILSGMGDKARAHRSLTTALQKLEAVGMSQPAARTRAMLEKLAAGGAL